MKFPCKKCLGLVELDTDSFEVLVTGKDQGCPVLKTTVKGYCNSCDKKHKYVTEETALDGPLKLLGR